MNQEQPSQESNDSRTSAPDSEPGDTAPENSPGSSDSASTSDFTPESSRANESVSETNSELDTVPVPNAVAPNEPAATVTPDQLLNLTAILELGLILLALVFAWFGISDPELPFNTWLNQNIVQQIAIGSALSVPLWLVMVVLLPAIPLFHDFFEFVEKKLGPMFYQLGVAQVILISILAGFGEEIFFRWCLQGALTPLVGLPLALLLASILFGMAHWLSTAYLIIATVMGLVLGLVYVYCGLWAAIACHAVYDFIAIMHFKRTGRNSDSITARTP